jgi:hypothetical protein
MLSALLDYSIRPCQHIRWDRQADVIAAIFLRAEVKPDDS